MSWIYLIVAGLFEVAFTSCMGKVKETTGSEMYWWFTGFLVSMSISMFLLIKSNTSPAHWYGLCSVDGNRCSGNCISRHTDIQRACYRMEITFHCNVDRFDHRFKSCFSLKLKNGDVSKLRHISVFYI